LNARIQALLTEARDPGTSASQRKANIAEAMAYQLELKLANDGAVNVDVPRVNDNIQSFMTALTLEERQGRLNSLASSSQDAFRVSADSISRSVDSYTAAEEFGMRLHSHIPDPKEQRSAARSYMRTRAGNLFRRMNRTWRFGGSSAEFNAAKKAIQEFAGLDNPTKADYYLAAEPVKAYVAKNIAQASSALGRTRMACSMAFLKQVMPEAAFRAYCNTLNYQRRIPSNIVEGQADPVFDRSNPRCFVPEEIGTIKEVYDAARERISELAKTNQRPSEREIAILTALRNLQARSRDGENTFVEHESLQEEIRKVQADRRFQAAMNRNADELCEMAFGGNIDKIQGYTEDLRPDQLRRIQESRALQAEEQQRAEEEEKQRILKETEDKRIADEKARTEEQERLREEQERLAREREEQEFLEKNTPLTKLYTAIAPEIQELANPLYEQFALLDDEDPVNKNTELVAKMLAYWEAGQNTEVNEKYGDRMLNNEAVAKRIEELKKDPIIISQARMLTEDPEMRNVVSEYTKRAEASDYSEKDKKVYPVLNIAGRLYKDYQKQLDARKVKPEPKGTVAGMYDSMKGSAESVISGKKDYKEAAKVISLAVAVHELERKHGGTEAEVGLNELQNRARQLVKDPLIEKISQDLKGPGRQKELERALHMKENRAQAFAEFMDGKYQEAVAEKQKAAAQKPSQPNKDAQIQI